MIIWCNGKIDRDIWYIIYKVCARYAKMRNQNIRISGTTLDIIHNEMEPFARSSHPESKYEISEYEPSLPGSNLG